MKCNDRASELKTKKGIGAAVNYAEQNKLTHKHLKAGDISHRIPIHPDAKTTVYCKPESDLKERRRFWNERLNPIRTK